MPKAKRTHEVEKAEEVADRPKKVVSEREEEHVQAAVENLSQKYQERKQSQEQPASQSSGPDPDIVQSPTNSIYNFDQADVASTVGAKAEEAGSPENDPLDDESTGEDQIEELDDFEKEDTGVGVVETKPLTGLEEEPTTPPAANVTEPVQSVPPEQPVSAPNTAPVDAQPGTLDDLAGDEDIHIPHISPTSTQQSVGMGTTPAFGTPPAQQPSQRPPFATTNDPGNYFSRHQLPSNSSGSRKIHLLILGLIGLAVIGATVYFLKYQSLPKSLNPNPTPVANVSTQTPVPTPTAAPTLDRSKYKVRVLNGTAKTGLAGTISTKLKDLGYQQDKTANATNSAFPRTVVRVKKSGTDLMSQLIKDLMPNFDATGSSDLKDSDTVDAEVILGNK